MRPINLQTKTTKKHKYKFYTHLLTPLRWRVYTLVVEYIAVKSTIYIMIIENDDQITTKLIYVNETKQNTEGDKQKWVKIRGNDVKIRWAKQTIMITDGNLRKKDSNKFNPAEMWPSGVATMFLP